MSGSESGYTVLEALVAFAILSLGLVSLYAATGTSLRGVDSGSQARRVAMLAQSKLDEIAATREPLPPTSQGAFAETDVAWRVETHNISSGFAGPSASQLQDVQLVLNWTQGGRIQSMVLGTRHLGIVRR